MHICVCVCVNRLTSILISVNTFFYYLMMFTLKLREKKLEPFYLLVQQRDQINAFI